MSEWLQGIVGYLLLVSVTTQMIPNKKYEQYVRLFTGFLLIVVLLQPVLKMPAMLCMFFVHYPSCPAGMNSVVFPAAYGEDCRPGASMVLVSSILSLVTLPVMYTLVTALCGTPTP